VVKEVDGVLGSRTHNDFLCQMYGSSESVKIIEVESVELIFLRIRRKSLTFAECWTQRKISEIFILMQLLFLQ
jgi:hypothetical protein